MRRTSPIPKLLLRRLRYRRILFVLLALLLASIYFTRPAGDDWAIYDRQQFVVTRVIDGDTIDVVAAYPGATPTRVRLLGVDAPEMHGDGGKAEYWADASTKYAIARSERQTVTLRLEPTQTRDRYKRLLAYVHLSDSETLNLALVRDGQAYADRRFRHTLRSDFEQAENAARKKRSGLWQDVKVTQMPEWRQRWLAERTSSSRAGAD